MQILTEGPAFNDIQLLSDAWDSKQTFAFIPDKRGVDTDFIQESLDSLPEEIREGHFLLLTSGSTGKPKLIVGQKKRSEALARLLHELQSNEAVQQTIITLPLSYSYAFVNQWLWSKVMGRELKLVPGLREPALFKSTLLEATNAKLCLVGAQYKLIAQQFGNEVFPGIIRVNFAGGRFPQEHLDKIRQMFPNATILNNYGCAEAMPRLTLRYADEADEAANIGKPLTNIKMKSDDDGNVIFQSPYGAVAWIDAEGYHPITADMWVPSGDMGKEQEDGSWVLAGRSNEVFKRFGEKISIAQMVTSVTKVWHHEVAFYRENDPSGEHGCVMVVTPHPDKSELKKILEVFRKEYSRTHWPLRIESVDEIPLLPNGKVNILGLSKIEDKTTHWRQRI